MTSIAAAFVRYLPTLMLLWLAFHFGRSLRFGATPLIERIARRGKPALSALLCRYTRRLTAAWAVFFLVAATLTLVAGASYPQSGVVVTVASALLFVGEYWMRRRLFPGEQFPDLAQQMRDTVSVWRPRRGI